MREFYFVVSPVEKHQEREIRVFGVEKGRRQEASYQEAERQAEYEMPIYKKQQVTDYQTPVSESVQRPHICTNLSSQMEMMKGCNISMEERQEQIAFQKKAQENRNKRRQMATAYGRE
ncbi:MAG: hypothetical protein GX284_01385 [Clostridiales bacterium]|nr:hypothetical protein [Clostridiales bacterium]